MSSVDPLAETSSTSHQARRVLIVDDNQDTLDLLVIGLEMLGHEVFSAADGTSALAVVEANHLDIAFLDVGLPDMDGYELARRIREGERVAKMRLVALTGYSQASDRERAFQAGFDAHLVKPVNLKKLEEVLKTLTS
jgi:CheY-like chemotaxis protein